MAKMMKNNTKMAKMMNRRTFLQNTGLVSGCSLLPASLVHALTPAPAATPKVSAHIWVYASAHPPDWDATPDLERAFSDIQAAGFDGVELMAVDLLKHDDAVEHINRLSRQYKLPVTGASFGADMWDVKKQDAILKDAATTIDRLNQLKGTTFGLSVGNAKRSKSESELDQQALVLGRIRAMCKPHGIVSNLHNHTYEVENNMHDLKGTMARIPDVKLGPDLNWLIRGGVDPVAFIHSYGKQMVYMHIRDQYADGVWTETVGQGITDFPAIVAALKEVNFQGRAAVELAFPDRFVPTQPLGKTWKDSREYVRRTFGW